MLQEQNGSQNLQKKKEEKVQSRELIGIGLILSIYDRREYIYIYIYVHMRTYKDRHLHAHKEVRVLH